MKGKKKQNVIKESIPTGTGDQKSVNDVDLEDFGRRPGTQKMDRPTNAKKEKRKSLKTRIPVKRKPKINWIQRHSFVLTNETWKEIHSEKTLIKGKYVEPFVKALNALPGVFCVLQSNGYNLAKEKFVIRFVCGHPQCEKIYQIRQVEDNNFVVSDNGATSVHVEKRTRQVRGSARETLQETLLTQKPTAYKSKAESEMNLELFDNGNLQGVKSRGTLKVIRHESIEAFDYDKDDIFDLFKMKIIADESKTDAYIQRITGVPFGVTLISDSQFNCLRKAAQSDEELTTYFDATGGVVRHGALRIYYYAGVIAANIMNEKTAKVIPIIQFINGKHDTFNIKIPLDEFKAEFHKRYPNDKWPIKFAVTDFSFASLNAICYSWNRMDLIDYINLVFTGLQSEADKSKIYTYLQLCIAHLSKTFAKDVDLYFPELSSLKQAVLQEIFAGMCNCSNLDDLEGIWTKLSTILLSRSASDIVSNALKSLASIMVKPYEEDLSTKIPDEDKLPEVEKIKENGDAIYKRSKFYQFFKTATFKEEFKINPGPQNAYYSVEFADLFLKKYCSIACLWTCLTQTTRKVNTYVEGHFKITKEHILDNSLTIGAPPLKSGRFIRMLKDDLNSQANAFLKEIPSERLCGNKQKNMRKQKTPKAASLLSLYSSSKSELPFPPKHQTKKDELPGIDNPHLEESWNRKSRSKHSFFKQKTLREISTGKTQVSKLLEQIPTKKSKKRNRKSTMSNMLVPKPGTYFSAEVNIAVASIGTVIIYRDSYKSLQSHSPVDNSVINYVFEAYRKDFQHVQFEASRCQFVISDQDDARSTFNLTKKIVIGSLLIEGQFALLIIDLNKNTFSYINSSTSEPSQTQLYFQNFSKFILRHNKKFKNKKIPEDDWSVKTYHHQLQSDVNDSGIFILNFVNQYLTSSEISSGFNVEEYRLEVQHYILRKATIMKNKCVICGFKEPPEHKQKNVDWVGCCSRDCDRWTHIPCARVNATIDEDFDKYFCFICKASTVQTDTSVLREKGTTEDKETNAVGDEASSAGDEGDSAGGEVKSAGDEASSVDNESSSAGDEENSAGHEESSSGDEEDSAGDEQNNAGDEASSVDDESSSAGDEENSAGHEENSSGDEEDSAGDEQNSAGDKASSVDDESSSAGDEANSAGDEANSAGGESNSFDNEASSAGDEANSAGDEASSVSDEASSVSDETGDHSADDI